jgi:predicted N-acetyltransferase YhbS
MNISIRTLEDADLEQADAILQLAFQDSTSRLHDLRMYRKMEPKGWLVATRGDDLRGMVGAVNYGAFAHVGFMAVHPDTQGQGIGFSLMQFLLAELEKQHVPLVMLDSSRAGRSLYDKLGFIAYDETLVFRRERPVDKPGRSFHTPLLSVQALDEIEQLDAGVFGADRRKVLQILLDEYPGRVFLHRDEHGKVTGYLFAQKNRIGPWVMLQPGNAEILFLAALGLPYDGDVSVTVPAGNQEAIGLIQRYGFEQVRANRHMGRGAGGPPGQRQKVYSQTSLAVG